MKSMRNPHKTAWKGKTSTFAHTLPNEVSVNALKDRAGGETSGFRGQIFYSWGELRPGPFLLRLGGLWLVTFTTLGLPIAVASFNPSRDPLIFALAAGTGTLFVMSLIVLRIYLGWSYVGDRLLSAVIPYEESGWYDRQMWVKPPEVNTINQDQLILRAVLARDRLLALLVTGLLLFIFATPVEDFIHTTFGTKQNPSSVAASKISSKLNISKEELLKLPTDVKANDDLAAAAAEAADGRPVYCRDRFYRALAGGQYCKWEDLLKRCLKGKR
ncbi:unnamed protein product [Malus baccata var. baccata]